MNNTNKFPQLETDRLILRELTYEDIPVVFTHFSNEEIARYQDALPAKNTEEAKEIIDWGKNLVKQKTGALWGIFLKDEGDFLGQVNCVFRSDNNFTMQVHRAELGYDLTPPYWGKGYSLHIYRYEDRQNRGDHSPGKYPVAQPRQKGGIPQRRYPASLRAVGRRTLGHGAFFAAEAGLEN